MSEGRGTVRGMRFRVSLLFLFLAVVAGLGGYAVLSGAAAPAASAASGGGRPGGGPPAPLVVEFLDVGQGDAILVTSPAGKRMLVDGGPPEAGKRLAAALKRRGIRELDLAVLTHPHLDHLGGLRAAFRQAPPKLFLDPGIDHATRSYERLLEWLGRKQVPVALARAGRRIDLGGGATAEVLWPPADPPQRLDVNGRSVVLRVSLGEVAFLLLGDAEARTEALLLRGGAERLRARVLKVGHHGSKHGSASRFLAAVGASHAVIPVGAGNPFGHPSAGALDRLERSGATVHRTDRDGTVTFRTDGRGLEVHVEKGGGAVPGGPPGLPNGGRDTRGGVAPGGGPGPGTIRGG
jgi:competence protein ComEC